MEGRWSRRKEARAVRGGRELSGRDRESGADILRTWEAAATEGAVTWGVVNLRGGTSRSEEDA